MTRGSLRILGQAKETTDFQETEFILINWSQLGPYGNTKGWLKRPWGELTRWYIGKMRK